MFEYEGERILIYGDEFTFIPKCEKCGRYVKADDEISSNALGVENVPNATCLKCGRTKMVQV